MAFIAKVKKDIEFYSGLAALLKVLKGIAISQFHIMERKVTSFDRFSELVDNFFAKEDLGEVRHPFVNPQTNSLAVVAVTSDTGLLGGLNMRVINAAFASLAEELEPGQLIVVGEKGKIYAQEQGVSCVRMEGINENSMAEQALALRNHIIKEVLAGKVGKVEIVYPRAHSLTVQRVERIRLLPYGVKTDKQGVDIYTYTLESLVEDVVEYLVYLWMGRVIYDIFSTSKVAEYAARFMHLEDCGNKLEELEEKTRFKYFRLRHELMDRGMRELFAARLLFGRK